MPEPIKIVLDPDQSAALKAAGECFLIVGRGSYPGATGRMALYCQPCPKDLADQACGVAMGTHRAARIKTQA